MQPNIAMKFAGYLAWILLRKRCKFDEKIYYIPDVSNLSHVGYFFGAPCITEQ